MTKAAVTAGFAALLVFAASCASSGGAPKRAVRVSASSAVTTTTSKFCYGVLKPETPVPGFNPLTASDAVLEQHDFPSRPVGQSATAPGVAGSPSLLAAWERYARAYMAGQVKECIGDGDGSGPTGSMGP